MNLQSCNKIIDFFLQVAIIAGNFELAELVKNHKETDIGKQQSSSSSFPLLLIHPSISPSPIFPLATQCVFLNLPRDTFQIPPWFDPPKWPLGIIPSVGLRECCQEDESLCLHQDNPGPIRPGEMINASASGSFGLVGTGWSVSRGVDWSVWFCMKGFD